MARVIEPDFDDLSEYTILRDMNFFYGLQRMMWRASCIGFRRGPRLSRYALYQAMEAQRLAQGLGKVLSISHSDRLVEKLQLTDNGVVSANFPEHNILSLDFPDNSFGYVVSDQVLEHVEGDPFRAVQECRRVLKPGGIAIHATCFAYPIHGAPQDFWRFTPHALGLMHADWSAILEVGGWGNFPAYKAIKHDIHMVKIPHAAWHPLHKLATKNDPTVPITTWIIARK